MSREWTAKWIGPETGDESHPVIFKDFYIDDEIKKATLYITGLGIFEAYVNGQRVGGEYLTPYQNAGAKELQYFSFDVTDLLHCGQDSEANSIDVFLGKGWNDEDPFALKAEFEIEVYKNHASNEDDIEESADEAESINDELEDLLDEGFLDEALAEAEAEVEEQETEKIFLLAMKGDEKISPADAPFELDDLNELDNFLQGVIDTKAEAPGKERRHEASFFTMDANEPAKAPEPAEEEEDTEALEAEIRAAKARLEELKARLSKTEEKEKPDEDDMEIFDFEDWDETTPAAPYNSQEMAAAAPSVISPASIEEAMEYDEPAEYDEAAELEESFDLDDIDELETAEEITSPGADLEVAPYSITDAELEAMFDDEPGFAEPEAVEDAEVELDEEFDEELEEDFNDEDVPAESINISDELPEDLGDLLSDEELTELIGETDFEEKTEDLDAFEEEPVVEETAEDLEASVEQPAAVTLVGGLPFVVKDTDHDAEPDEAEAFVDDSLADALDDIVNAEEAHLADEGTLVGGLPLAEDNEPEAASEEVLKEWEDAAKVPAAGTEAALMGGLPFEVKPAAYVGSGLTDAVDNITKNEEVNIASEGDLIGGLSIAPEALERSAEEENVEAAEPEVTLVGGLPFVMKAADEETPEEVQPLAAVDEDMSETLDSLINTEDAPIVSEGALVGGLPVAPESDTKTILIASDETWCYYASDIEFSSLDHGEIFNRLLWDGKENPERNVAVLDLDIPLVERYSLPVIVKERLDVKDVIKAEDGSYILDFGQDFAGFVAFNSSQPKGAHVHLSFAEELLDGAFPEEAEEGGFTFISDGMPEVVGPHFTYFTGRFVKVSGWEGELKSADFSGCVLYSDMPRSGYVETSNERLNTIYQELLAGQKRSSIVMPEESEAEDVFAYAPAAAYNMEIKDFLMQYLKGLKEQPVSDQTAYAPQIIWNLYQMYGDERILEDNYELIKAWVDAVDAKDAERIERHYLCDYDSQSEAWVSMDQETDTEYIASACYYEAARITAEAASVLGKEQDAFAYGRLARKIKQAFLEEYYTGAGRLSIDTQTAYVLALQFGLYVEKDRVAKGLAKRLEKDGDVLKCAPAAAPFICKALADHGMTDKAYDILLNEEQKSFNNEVEFIYEYMAGIKALEPGFKTIGLSPIPDGRLDYCKARFNSPVGEVVSNWEVKEDGSLNFHFDVPEGATAKITLPYYPVCAAGGNEVTVKSGSYDYSYMPSVKMKKDATEE